MSAITTLSHKHILQFVSIKYFPWKKKIRMVRIWLDLIYVFPLFYINNIYSIIEWNNYSSLNVCISYLILTKEYFFRPKRVCMAFPESFRLTKHYSSGSCMNPKLHNFANIPVEHSTTLPAFYIIPTLPAKTMQAEPTSYIGPQIFPLFRTIGLSWRGRTWDHAFYPCRTLREPESVSGGVATPLGGSFADRSGETTRRLSVHGPSRVLILRGRTTGISRDISQLNIPSRIIV